MLRTNIVFNFAVFASVVIAFFYLFSLSDSDKFRLQKFSPAIKVIGNINSKSNFINETSDYNVWLIFTKVMDRSPLMHKFSNLLKNLLSVSSISLKLNIIVDDKSKLIAAQELLKLKSNIPIQYTFHNMTMFAEAIEDIVDAMTPYFSSRPGTYYSDALFYISLGLYRIAPINQSIAVMLDCDVLFKDDVLKLFQQFQRFEEGNLFGLAPELSPVYKHVLYSYKQKHNTTFGEYYHSNEILDGVHSRGFQGYNSGVILFNLSAIRNSEEYRNVIKKDSVKSMVDKYNFRGHLGDQDFYTLLGYEYPHMIRTLNCGFNRQLCTWWRDKGGYKDSFHNYFNCKHKTVVVHGNCNTKIPL